MKATILVLALSLFVMAFVRSGGSGGNKSLDDQLKDALNQNKFDGKIQDELVKRLGRQLDAKKVNLGRLIFFDKGLGLYQDNSCAGCHAPNFGFGDSQPIAIGINSNDTVGVHRKGPRNQRRTPTVVNTAFYPNLMWNGRFSTVRNDAFNTSKGFIFPPPEGNSIFKPNVDYSKQIKHLLVAQGHIPFTEQPEMAGFTATGGIQRVTSFSRFSGLMKETEGEEKPMLFTNGKSNGALNRSAAVCNPINFDIFDDGKGYNVPPPDPQTGSSNFSIRSKVLSLINANAQYKTLFGQIYPAVKNGGAVTFLMVGEVVAEFEFSLTFAQAPVDAYARGNKSALTTAQKRGGIIFFTTGKCASCHSTADASNQMFSDFKMHNAGTPQIYPLFGAGTGNVPFSDLNCPKSATGTLDFGGEEFTGNPADRYFFRSSPLRNLKLQSSFFHNGSFQNLKDAVTYHLKPKVNIANYTPAAYGVPADLHYRSADMPNVMLTLDPILKTGISLTNAQISDLVDFLTNALYDNRLTTNLLQGYIPTNVPSGIALQTFEFGTGGSIAKPAPAFTTENLQLKFSIYPNPATDVLHVQLPEGGVVRAEILTASGSVLLATQVVSSAKSLTLPVERLKAGTYFVRVTDKKNQSFTRQFLKQ